MKTNTTFFILANSKRFQYHQTIVYINVQNETPNKLGNNVLILARYPKKSLAESFTKSIQIGTNILCVGVSIFFWKLLINVKFMNGNINAGI